jgi:hypothetical protein
MAVLAFHDPSRFPKRLMCMREADGPISHMHSRVRRTGVWRRTLQPATMRVAGWQGQHRAGLPAMWGCISPQAAWGISISWRHPQKKKSEGPTGAAVRGRRRQGFPGRRMREDYH